MPRADQTFSPLFLSHDARLLDPSHLLNSGLDLAELDTKAAYLDLMIDAAEMLQSAIRKPAAEVSCAIEPRVRLAREPVGDKSLGCQFRVTVISGCQTISTDPNFAWGADGGALAGFIENVDLQYWQLAGQS